MSEVVPIRLDTPKQLVLSMAQNAEAYDDIQSMACVKVSKDGDIFIAHNRMTTERMIYLAAMLHEYAIQL